MPKGLLMNKIVKMTTFSAMCLALALVLPLITGQIRTIGNMLCPMHIPVLLCGFICGPVWGLVIGFAAPLLRSLCFGMPALFPNAVGMAFELAAYGVISGLLFLKLPKKPWSVYVSLICAIVGGRLVWGAVRFVMLGLFKSEFSFEMFIGSAFLTAWPGIILQIILIPAIVLALRKAGIKDSGASAPKIY